VNKQKKAIIAQSIPLDDAQSAGFWKLYDAYEDGYNKLLAEHILENNRRLDDLHETYFGRFKKAVGGTKAATLFQLELFIQTELQYRIQKQLPLIAEKMTGQ